MDEESESSVDYRLPAIGFALGILAQTDLRRQEIVRPSSIVAMAYERISLPLFDRVEASARESIVLAAIRDALLPKLLSGQIRIRNAEKLVEAAV
jgi:type I restriction enzyme, S subunit